jgi:hypothetical protein
MLSGYGMHSLACNVIVEVHPAARLNARGSSVSGSRVIHSVQHLNRL